MTIALYQLPPAYDLPVSGSPYCAKLELYMRLTERDFEAHSDVFYRFRSPNKLVPYVVWEDGTKAGGSDEIIEQLEARGPALDTDRTPEEHALAEPLVAGAEGPIYFACLFSRFSGDVGWADQSEGLKRDLPFPATVFLPGIIQKDQLGKCARNGVASVEDTRAAIPAIEAISEALGDKPYLHGDDPSVADCALWAPLLQTAATWAANPPRDHLRADSRLMDYLHRLADRAQLTLPDLTR